jgi:plastocyanin
MRRNPGVPWDASTTVVVALTLLVLGSAHLGSAHEVAAFGTIEGTVALPPASSAPAPKARYPMAAGYDVGPADPPAAVVYLEGTFAEHARDASTAEVAQHRYQFAPGLLAVQRGTVVRFPNQDDEYHSVFSYSKAKRFDLGRYAKDDAPATLTFDQTGVVHLYCEIHDHMRGTILVLDTPYFQKTDAEGRYRLTELPPGRFVLKARAWDRDAWRVDTALGYRFDRHLQGKIQYSFTHQLGNLQQGEQLVAAQLTLKF